jgi:hypothetical protein
VDFLSLAKATDQPATMDWDVEMDDVSNLEGDVANITVRSNFSA